MNTPLQKSKRAVLTFLSGEYSNETIKLRYDATIFGREKGDVIIQDAEISSTHCQIHSIGDTYHIFDMNSTNGTHVNGEKVVKSILRDGDIINIGTTSFRFETKTEAQLEEIQTILTLSKNRSNRTSSVVETLIESELRSTMPSGLRIKVTYKDGSGEELVFNQRIVFIGRSSTFGEFSKDKEMSRKHLMIKLNNSGEIFIEDQGSTNGSFLNGKKIKGMHNVKPQDQIKVGDTSLIIFVQNQR